MMYRAYYAMSAAMTAPDGTPTNAVHGFMVMLFKVIAEEQPDLMAVAFDLHAPTFRAKLYDGYKATRKPMPDDLRAQDPVIRELITRMGLPILECESYEADDILGTISAICEKEDATALLVTGDRDSFQLAGPHTTILYTKKGITDTEKVTPDYVKEKYGVEPLQLIDVKSLMGDTSDNIPGIAGIGEKTALKLISTYGNLEEVLSKGPEKEKGKLRDRLIEGADSARMSRVLAEIVRNVPIEVDISKWTLDKLSEAIPRLRQLGMVAAIKRLEETIGKLGVSVETEVPETKPVHRIHPTQVSNVTELAERLSDAGSWISIYMDRELSVTVENGEYVLPLGGDLLSPGVTDEEVAEALTAAVNNAEIVYIHNAKTFPMLIGTKAFDVMLAAYVLDPQHRSFDAEALCEDFDIPGYADQPSHAIYELAMKQKAELIEKSMEKVFYEIEMPLAYVLRDMENVGFRVDADTLNALGDTFDTEIERLRTQILAEFGEPINLKSPKQLGEMLFVKMGLPTGKKKGKGYSTNAEVLENLAEDYPICAKILEYRKYQKLRSTYIESLIRLRDEQSRVHTRFDQVATVTGRLSSNEPNLQNIPVRTEIGKQIRGAFVAGPGCVLIDADYSQIELRVLAHISGDETMIAAFNADEDIHARTAAEVYGISIEQVTHQMRSACKAVNFGIVYGISDFALAKNIGVSRAEAKQFIERYFERYPNVRKYMQDSVEQARSCGYAVTMFGRRRYLPELQSANFNIRSFGERCAMNSPIQGTAADIIKLAMLRVDEAIRASGLNVRMILQVHDELILEASEEDAEKATEILRTAMEGVAQMKVPLKTEIGVGGDWSASK